MSKKRNATADKKATPAAAPPIEDVVRGMAAMPGITIKMKKSLAPDLKAAIDGAVNDGEYMIAVWRITDKNAAAISLFLNRTGYSYDLLLRSLKLLETEILKIEPPEKRQGSPNGKAVSPNR